MHDSQCNLLVVTLLSLTIFLLPSKDCDPVGLSQRQRMSTLKSRVSQLEAAMANANNPLGLKIEQFGGTEGEIPKEWLDKFDVFSSFQGWKEEKKASAFCLLLTGVVDLWYKKANYDTVTTKFPQKFARKTPTWIDVEGLMSQKQSQLESVGDYIKRIKLIDAESNLQEETYMTVFKKSTNPLGQSVNVVIVKLNKQQRLRNLPHWWKGWNRVR